MRFDEFLLAEEQKAQREAELERQAMNEFSFNSDASYELLVSGPALRRDRPDNVPPLSFRGLPEYETTTEEEEEYGSEEKQQQQMDQQ